MPPCIRADARVVEWKRSPAAQSDLRMGSGRRRHRARRQQSTAEASQSRSVSVDFSEPTNFPKVLQARREGLARTSTLNGRAPSERFGIACVALRDAGGDGSGGVVVFIGMPARLAWWRRQLRAGCPCAVAPAPREWQRPGMATRPSPSVRGVDSCRTANRLPRLLQPS